MTVPRSSTASLFDQSTNGRPTAAAAAGTKTLTVEGDDEAAVAEYAILVGGDVWRPDAVASAASDGSTTVDAPATTDDAETTVDVSTTATDETDDDVAAVTSLDAGATLVSGHVHSEPASFVVTGDVLGVTVDGPEPTVSIDGDAVDLSAWPSVDRAIHERAGEAPVENPFPNAAELAKPLGDPLDPRRYEISVDARDADEPQSYEFDVAGEVLQHPDDAVLADGGETVSGEVGAGEAARIAVRGLVVGIDTDGDVDISVEQLP